MNKHLGMLDQVTPYAALAAKPELPFDGFFEDPNYNLEFMDQRFREEVLARMGTQFTEEEVQWIFYTLDVVAFDAHKGQIRKERDANGNEIPYIIHPIEVALDAVLDGEDAITVCSLLLHDTREDTKLQYWHAVPLQIHFGWGTDHSRGKEVEIQTYLLSGITLAEPKEDAPGEYYERGEKLSDERFLKKIRSTKKSRRGKARDRKKNLESFGRMVRQMPGKVAEQIYETRKYVYPFLEEIVDGDVAVRAFLKKLEVIPEAEEIPEDLFGELLEIAEVNEMVGFLFEVERNLAGGGTQRRFLIEKLQEIAEDDERAEGLLAEIRDIVDKLEIRLGHVLK